jgi:hypothetical protein
MHAEPKSAQDDARWAVHHRTIRYGVHDAFWLLSLAERAFVSLDRWAVTEIEHIKAELENWMSIRGKTTLLERNAGAAGSTMSPDEAAASSWTRRRIDANPDGSALPS